MVMVYLNLQVVFIPYNPYAMEMNRENKNCYNCGRFGHLAKNCKNKENRIGKGRRLEYKNENQGQSNLNGERDLIVLN